MKQGGERVKVETRLEGCLNGCMTFVGCILFLGIVVGLLIEAMKAVF